MLVIRRLFGTGTNCIAPSGLPLLLCLFPGLAPWAFLSRPCGASFAPETSLVSPADSYDIWRPTRRRMEFLMKRSDRRTCDAGGGGEDAETVRKPWPYRAREFEKLPFGSPDAAGNDGVAMRIKVVGPSMRRVWLRPGINPNNTVTERLAWRGPIHSAGQ